MSQIIPQILDQSLIAEMRYLYNLYRDFRLTRASILVGTAAPIGAVLENEFSLFLNKDTGEVFHAAEGSVWRLVANIRGPTGAIGPTGATGPCFKGCTKCNDSNCKGGCGGSCGGGCNTNECGKTSCSDGCGGRLCCNEPRQDPRGCGQSHEYHSFPVEQNCHNQSNSYNGYGGHNSHGGHQNQIECYDRNRSHQNHPLGNTIIPKVTQAEAVNITPQGLVNSVLTLSAIPCNCNASIDVSFCGSFTNAVNAMVPCAPSDGKLVVTASTSIWSVSMTVDFKCGQTKWSGAFNRALTLIPGNQNKVFVSVGYQSDQSATGITLTGVNDFVSARLMYDI